MNQRPGLGRGLEALIPGGYQQKPDDSLLQIAIEDILPNPRQPRREFGEQDLVDLASSITEHGILQPLVVSPASSDNKYTLIAGERRLRAAGLAGLEKVPAIVRKVEDQQRLELALIENIQRTDLSPLDTAEAYAIFSNEFNLSHEEIANKVGKSRVSVTNTLRLLNLPDVVKEALRAGKISEGHARALLALASEPAQSAALATIVQRELTVRQTEELVKRLSGEKGVVVPKPAAVPELTDLENRLISRLGTKVALHPGKRGGTITIHYYSDEELNTLINQLLGN